MVKGKYEITWYFLLIPNDQISVVRKNVAVVLPRQAGQEQEQGVKSAKSWNQGRFWNQGYCKATDVSGEITKETS